MSDRVLTDLASAVSDGEVIDWPAARSRLSTTGHHSVVDQLHALAGLAGPVAGVRAAHERPPSPWLQAVRVASIASVVVGLTGHIVVLGGTRGRPVLFGVSALFVAAALMLDLGGRDRRARALAAGYWTIAAAFCADRVLALISLAPDSFILRVVAGIRPEAFFAACLWNFAREFPRVTRFSRLNRLYTLACAVALVLGSALAVANVVLVAAPDSTLAAQVAVLERISGSAGIFWTVIFGTALPALAAIGFRAREATGDEGRRARRFLYVIAFTIGPVAAEVIAEGLNRGFFLWAQTYRWWLGWIVYPLLIALPVGTAYVVAARDVLDVRVVIQRGLRYSLTRWLILWGAIVPLLVLVGYLYAHRDQPLGTTLDAGPARAMIWTAGIAVAVLLVRRRLVALLDRALLPDMVEPSAMLAHLAEGLKNARTPIEVTRTLANAAERALQAGAEAYVRRNDQLVPLSGGQAMPANSVIGALLVGAREPCVVGPEAYSYYRLLSEGDREWIQSNQVRVLLPIASNRGDGRVMGMVALKERRSALSYSEDDLRFLRAASASASLACEALATAAGDRASSLSEPEEVAGECDSCGRVGPWQTDPCHCGGRWRPASLPARLAGRFEITQVLGAGGMGIVYRATDATLKRDVAAKTIPSLSDAAAARLLTEAQAMAAFSHQHIATLYGTELWRGTPVLLMEYMAGGTLAVRLRRKRLDEEEALGLIRRLATALEEVHGSGVFHGDIKPSNIGFTRDGVPKFLDFGLARAGDLGATDQLAHASQARRRGVTGTLAYMSPEVLDGGEAGPGLDLWALSLVLLECLSGEPVVRVATRGADVGDAVHRSLARLEGRASAGTLAFLQRSLSSSPAARPASARELIHQLSELPPARPA